VSCQVMTGKVAGRFLGGELDVNVQWTIRAHVYVRTLQCNYISSVIGHKQGEVKAKHMHMVSQLHDCCCCCC
jgi:hypothetical protein